MDTNHGTNSVYVQRLVEKSLAEKEQGQEAEGLIDRRSAALLLRRHGLRALARSSLPPKHFQFPRHS